jgi:hypothetical protein
MKRVVLESPYGARWFWQRWLNRRYARACMLDALRRQEAPMASHLLYTQVLSDQNPQQRAWGIDAGLAWLAGADATVVYTDRGISAGMRQGIAAAERKGMPVTYRSLSGVGGRRAL